MKMRIKKVFSGVFILVVLAAFSAVRGQTPAASPTPTPSATPSVPDVPADEEVLSVETALVNIPVSVTDAAGRVVPGLARENFQIFENGVPQKIEYFASTEEPFTVVLLLDVSGSVKENLGDIKRAALAFLDQLKPEDRVMGITFDMQLRVLNTDLRDREGLRKAIRDIDVGGGTYLYATTQVVSNRLLQRFKGRKALVLFTDGIDGWHQINGLNNTPVSNYETSLAAAEASGALVYAVQFNAVDDIEIARDAERGRNRFAENKIANSYLKDLTERTGGAIYRTKRIKELKTAFASVADELRRQYSIGYYPPTPAKKGERRRVSIAVDQPGAKARARDSYIGRQ